MWLSWPYGYGRQRWEVLMTVLIGEMDCGGNREGVRDSHSSDTDE